MKSTTRRPLTKSYSALWLSVLCLSAAPSWGADLYWDINGATTPGNGTATPTGAWTATGPNWSTDPTGSIATGNFAASETAVFSAGSDATGSFNITITGTFGAAGITVEEGTVNLTGTGAISPVGTVTVNTGATLSIDNAGRLVPAAGAKIIVDGSTLRNTVLTTAGSFFPAGFEIAIGGGGATFNYPTSNILNIIQTGTHITGTGGFTKTGAGVLAVASTVGFNTYAGPTIVNDGELRIRTVANTLPTTTPVTVNSPGIFNLNAVSQQIGSLSGNGNVGTGSATLTISGTASTTFTGALKDIANAGAVPTTTTGGKLTKSGSGVITFGGVNDITGLVTLTAGGITVDPGAALSAPTSPLTVNGGTLTFNNAAETVSTFQGTAGTVSLGTGHVFTIDPAANGAFAGNITGPGALTKLNVLSGATARTLTLSGNNSYDGVTTVSGGVVSVGSATALGSVVGDTSVAAGAELLFTGAAVNFTIAEPIKIAGAGGADNGAIAVIASANPTLSGPITLTGDTTITVSSSASATFNNPNSITSLANQSLTLQGGLNASGTAAITGAIALGSGNLIKLQTSKWTLTGANTYTGTTTIGAGTIVASNVVVSGGASNLGNATSAVILGAAPSTSGALSYTGTAATYTRGFSIAGVGRVDTTTVGETLTIATADITSAGGATVGNLTFGGAGNIVVSSNILIGTGGMTKTDSGLLTLAGSNTFSGATAVNVGTLLLTGTIGGTSGVTVAGTLGGNGTMTLASGGGVSLSASGKLSPGTSVGTLNAILSGGGAFNITSGVTATNSQSLLFELDTVAASDKINITGGALNFGAGVLEFDDFVFTTLGGFDLGTYTLFAGDTAITDTFGPVVDGTLGSFDAHLQLGDSDTDVVLVVAVPESGSAALMLGGLGMLAAPEEKEMTAGAFGIPKKPRLDGRPHAACQHRKFRRIAGAFLLSPNLSPTLPP